MMKLWGEFHALLWTIAASVTTILTLSGAIQRVVIWLTVGALVLHLIGALNKKEDSQLRSSKMSQVVSLLCSYHRHSQSLVVQP
jgi:hypothetical protein